MVDFKKLREGKGKPLPIHPREIFNSLPKPQGINDLYASQAEVLDAWFGRRTDRDNVIKLHTGGGKTLCALLMAQSVMNEVGEPVLYLAPTKQLVEQVLAKSREYGISAAPYTSGQPLPAEFHNGKTVLVGAYEALFNGRSKFGVRGSGREVVRVGAIILDDAHVALSSVRDSFTLTVTAEDHRAAYDELVAQFRPAFSDVGRAGLFHDIVQNNEHGVVEVPVWAWQSKLGEVQAYLAANVDKIDPFIWPLLRDVLPFCHCIFSKASVTITPLFPPVDLIPTFEDAPRRIYMSATISDDSEIVRTFAASADAVSKPISSVSLAGVGERMILVPQLMTLGNHGIDPTMKSVVQSIAAKKMGVAILTPSTEAAKRWQDVAQRPKTSAEVLAVISSMQAGNSFGPVVLANRYDGIDLAGNACRCLVLDGLPHGTSDYDVYRAGVLADSSVNSLLAQRIEQGVGRGTRGGSDYCVVFLTGTRLVSWVGRTKNLAHLTASTRVQLKMGREVSDAVTNIKEMYETADKCLHRDADWVAYHASELAEAAHATEIDVPALKIAGQERRAFKQARFGQHEAAIQTVDAQIQLLTGASDISMRAWLWSMAARLAVLAGDDVRAQRFQTNAFSVNNNHTPPKVRPAYIVRPKPGQQAKVIVDRLLEYDRRLAIIAEFDEAVTNLVPGASASRYEESLECLGMFLGFDAERPEKLYDTGPDVLWRTDGEFDFVIEAKHRKDGNTPLYRNEHAQLLESQNWFSAQYPGRASVRVSAVPTPLAHQQANTNGTLALKLTEISRIVGALRNLLNLLVNTNGDAAELKEVCEAELRRLHLKPAALKDAFMIPFEKR